MKLQEFKQPDNGIQPRNQEAIKGMMFSPDLKATILDLETGGFAEHKGQKLKSSYLARKKNYVLINIRLWLLALRTNQCK